jgi:hypothetical protein
MAKITRYEFVGSKWLFFLLWVLGITIPFAILYLVSATAAVEEEVGNPAEFLDGFRAKVREW